MSLLRSIVGGIVLGIAASASAGEPCPVATPEPFWVEPVTSPTDETYQTIRIHIGNGDRVEVIAESGHFIDEGDFGAAQPAEVPVRLARFFTNHLEVVAHVKSVTSAGCTYGDYTLRTTTDQFGAPLEIVQTGYAPSPTPVVTDVSSFSKFEFKRVSALGFCPLLDEVFAAKIRFREGAYELDMSILQPGSSGVDTCLPNYLPEDTCAVPVPLPRRNLTTDELGRVQDVFADFPILYGPDPRCDDTHWDPCVINVAIWDSIGADDYPCSAGRRLQYQAVEELEELFEGLRPDRTPQPTATPTPTLPPPTQAPSPTYLPEPLLVFDFNLEPPHPVVGDLVTLRVSLHNTRGFAGQPGFGLNGARPSFAVESELREPDVIGVLSGATLTYSLRAQQAGRAELSIGAIYEICIGPFGAMPCYRGGMSSQTFTVEIGAEPTSTATTVPSPTATPVPSPTATTAPSGGSGCGLRPSSGSAMWLVCLLALALPRTMRMKRISNQP